MTDPADDRGDDEESRAAAPGDDADAEDADVNGEDRDAERRGADDGAVDPGPSERAERADGTDAAEGDDGEPATGEDGAESESDEGKTGDADSGAGDAESDSDGASDADDGADEGPEASEGDDDGDDEDAGDDGDGDDGDERDGEGEPDAEDETDAEEGPEAEDGDETDTTWVSDDESADEPDDSDDEDADDANTEEDGSDDDADPMEIPPSERRDDWDPPEDYEPAEVPISDEDGDADDGGGGGDGGDDEGGEEGLVGTATSVAESAGGGLMDAEVSHAPDDEEQPLEVHVTEMVHRFLAVAVAMAGVAAIVLLWSDDLINFLWYSFLGPGAPLCPGQECPQMFRPHLYHPLSLVLARLKVAVLVGFVVGLPVAVYQTYLFMRPGLYPRERRYYLAAVPTSLVLAAVGVAFAYFLILPALFSYFMGYSTRAAEAALGLAETFNIMVILLGFFALVFQIPLLVMLAIMMGVTTRRWLEDRRLYFWMGFGGVAFIFSPDPTGMAPLLVAVTMIALFEGTLTLLRWTGRDSPILAPEPMRARRPHAWVLALFAGYVVSAAPLPTGYYDRLPSVVTQVLGDLGWTALTPLLVAVAIVAAFEVSAHVLRRLGAGLRVQLWIYRVRWAVWLAAAGIGYLASPEPTLLESARATQLEPHLVAAVVLGVAVVYEILVQLVVWRRG